MPYSKHTNVELLAEACNCIGDLAKEITASTGQELPPVEALRAELYRRTKGVTFETGRTGE